MKPGFVAFFGVLLGGAALVAQGSGQSSFGAAGMEGVTSMGQAPVFDGCPVSMRAQHLSDGNIVSTRSGHPNGVGQWMHLTMVGMKAQQIARAMLMVRGFSARGRVAGAAGSTDSYVVRTVTVAFVASGDSGVSADVWVPDMTAVQRIDLKSLEYSDGSTWKIGSDASCHVAPDLEMLITSR